MSNAGREPAAQEIGVGYDKARQALSLMGNALDLIDANDGPHDAGAYLDQAICRLRDWIAKRDD